MAEREKVLERVRRFIYFRSSGRCEYGPCSKLAARFREDGSVVAIGNFSHILPVGGVGPRWQFKKDFPNVDIDSANNVILLCEEHHRLIDRDEVSKHPPALLFEMARRKGEYVNHGVDDFFVSNPFRFDHEEILKDTRIGRIFDLMNEARIEGPKRGKKNLKQAESVLRDIVNNPFVQIPDDFVELIKLEIVVNGCVNAYYPDAWRGALNRAQTCLRKISDGRKLASAILLSGIFVRDEYGIFTDEARLGHIRLLLEKLDPLIVNEELPTFLSFLLGIKAGLLRWRGRILRSTAQQNSFAEADRCATLSIEKCRTPGGILQLCLIKFTKARSLPLADLAKYDEEIAAAISPIASEELDDFPPAIKYRPRFFRDIYEFNKGIDYFWRAVDFGYASELKRIAYILGECSTSSYAFLSNDVSVVQRAAEFLQEAIADGYDHERNFISWINCRSMLDPDWFKEGVLARFRADTSLIDLVKILHSDTARFFGPDSFSHDVLFGIDESEFWNMLGRLSRTVIDDPDAALAFYERAERHDRSPGGSFTTKVGRVRVYTQKRERALAERYLKMARNTARAYQAKIIDDLQMKINKINEGDSNKVA